MLMLPTFHGLHKPSETRKHTFQSDDFTLCGFNNMANILYMMFQIHFVEKMFSILIKIVLLWA